MAASASAGAAWSPAEGDYVWARYGSLPWWPCQVARVGKHASTASCEVELLASTVGVGHGGVNIAVVVATEHLRPFATDADLARSACVSS